MFAAPRPKDEEQRLESLRKLRLLDTPLEERFERLTRQLCSLLDIPIAAFTLVDDQRQWFKSIQGLNEVESSRSMSICSHTILGDEVLEILDARLDQKFRTHPYVTGPRKVTFYAGCPIRAPDGKKIGTLCAMDTKPREMTAKNVKILRDIAFQLEEELKATVQQSAAQQQLIAERNAAQRQALIDPLTRLWNRDGIMELLKSEWTRAQKNKISLTVVVADIDYFKKINDTHGPQIGDAALQAVARNLLSTLQPGEAIGRLGGEEFLMILPACVAENLPKTVEQIRLSAAKAPVRTPAGKLELTLSYGAAALFPDASRPAEELVALAERALHEAKEAGRNCSKVATAA